MKICLYQDYLHNNGALYKVLVTRYGREAVHYVDAQDILDGALEKDTAFFVMPGGESRYVADKLRGEGNHRIRAFVKNGGQYLGICAGAYYACAGTEWRQEREAVALTVENDLALCPLIAKGPVSELPCFGMDEEIPVQITGIEIKGQRYDVLYWGGPLFYSQDCHAGLDPASGDNIQVLGSYADISDHPPAIIRGKYGQGRYILCSPHIEFTTETFNLMRYDVPRNAHAHLNPLDASGLNAAVFRHICDALEDQL